MDQVCLIAGNSNIELAQSISNYLNIPLTSISITKFNNTELAVKCNENIRQKSVFVIQTGSALSSNYSVNDALVELLTICNACTLSSPSHLTAIVPNFPYARSDKKDMPRTCINAKMVCQLLETQGVERIASMDLHSGQIQGFFNGPFDNLYGINIFISYLKKHYLISDEEKNNFVLVSPDAGSIKRVTSYAERLQLAHIIMHKQRDYTKVSHVVNSVIVGDVSGLGGKTGILIDDIVDTAGTMNAVVNELSETGMKNFIIIATHGIFSAPALDRINANDMITSVIVTNTISQVENIKKCNKIVSIDVGPLFGEAIKRMITGESISELFEMTE